MKTLNEYIERQLENPEFAAAWREGEGEYQAMRALVLARVESCLSQRELSDRAGVPQKTISLIETADANTTVRTLSKLAQGMGKVLRISFEDRGQDESGDSGGIGEEP